MVGAPIFKPEQRCGGAYDILRFLGGNSAHESYLATHSATRTRAVLTCSTFQHVKGDPPSADAFHEWVERRRRFLAEGVPKIHGGGVDSGVYWVAEQHIDAPKASEVVGHRRTQPLSPEWVVLDALAAAALVAFILRAAHEMKIQHGGLTPQCILIDGLPDRYDAVLLGLGRAELFMLDARAARLEPRYRAPEQLEDGVIDARSDIYSLGMVLYALIAGAPPFADRQPADLDALCALAEREAPRPLPEIAFCPGALWSFVARMTAKDPRDRFQTWNEMLASLEETSSQVLRNPRVMAVVREHDEQVRQVRNEVAGQDEPRNRAAPAADLANGPRTVPPGPETRRQVTLALTRLRSTSPEEPPRVVQPAPAPALLRRSQRTGTTAGAPSSPAPGTPPPAAQRSRTHTVTEGAEAHDTDPDPAPLGATHAPAPEGATHATADEAGPVTLPSAAPAVTAEPNAAPRVDAADEAHGPTSYDAPSSPAVPLHQGAPAMWRPRLLVGAGALLVAGALSSALVAPRVRPELRALARGARVPLGPFPVAHGVATAPTAPSTGPAVPEAPPPPLPPRTTTRVSRAPATSSTAVTPSSPASAAPLSSAVPAAPAAPAGSAPRTDESGNPCSWLTYCAPKR